MPRRVECFFHLFCCWSDKKKVIFLHIGQIYLLARSILFFCKSEIRVNIECRKFKFHFLRSHLNKMLPSFKPGKIVWIFSSKSKNPFVSHFSSVNQKSSFQWNFNVSRLNRFNFFNIRLFFSKTFFFFRKYFLFLEIQFKLWPNRSIELLALGNMI